MEMISLDLFDISFFRILEFQERKKKKDTIEIKEVFLDEGFS